MLHVYPSVAFADGRAAHLPWLQEMPDPMTTVMWGSWVEISTETAHKLDIHEGDVLTIASPHTSIDLPAFLYPGLRPDVIAIPAGQGHTHGGRYAANRGANALRLGASTLDQVTGARDANRSPGERDENGTERTVDSVRCIGRSWLSRTRRCTGEGSRIEGICQFCPSTNPPMVRKYSKVRSNQCLSGE